MYFLDLTLPDLPANLALDEALLLETDQGGPPALRLWEWQAYAVVLGAGCPLAEDVDEAACARDRIPIVRRSSGGGTVVLGPGCLLFSLVLPMTANPALEQIRSSYAWIMTRLADALKKWAPAISPAGISDLAIGDRKCSGNSQQRKRTAILHHGTLLYDFDIARTARYLRMPDRQPEYRCSRSHAEFLTNLKAPRSELMARLREVWAATASLPAWPEARVAALVEERYGKTEWTKRR